MASPARGRRATLGLPRGFQLPTSGLTPEQASAVASGSRGEAANAAVAAARVTQPTVVYQRAMGAIGDLTKRGSTWTQGVSSGTLERLAGQVLAVNLKPGQSALPTGQWTAGPWGGASDVLLGGGGFRVLRPTNLSGLTHVEIVDQLTNTYEIARAAQRIARSGGAPFAVSVQIDLKPLAHALNSVNIQEQGVAISRGINRGIDRLWTRLKRDIQQWTGAKQQYKITERMKKVQAWPQKWSGAVVIKDHYMAITATTFGAKWNREMVGAYHEAWGRGQFAPGSFMIPGKAPVFHRVGRGRFPIIPLFGPNPAKEAERHGDEVQAHVEAVARDVVVPEIERQVHLAFQKSKAAAGL